MYDNDIGMTNRDISKRPTALGFLLIDGFSLMSYAALVEPFRAANRLSGEALYRWGHVSIDGAPVSASNGAMILPDAKVGDPLGCEMLFVFAAGDPTRFDDAATFGWLRRLAQNGVSLGGISGGPFLLARAGVLGGYRSTIHWDHREAFVAAFPDLELDQGLYVIDRRRLSCAGGSAGLDLAIDLIGRAHGKDLAARVSEWFIRTQPRLPGNTQRLSLPERYRTANPRLIAVLALMEDRLEEPARRATLAAAAGVSERQLERLFARHLGAGIGETYLRLRLAHAENLLRSTSLSITDVGLAAGFQSSSHFSRAFRARYGQSPQAFRQG